MNPSAIIDFWFTELSADDWFSGGTDLDSTISDRFTAYHAAATQNELSAWRETPLGALAEIIILDQFSRNIYRGEAAAFAADGQALVLAQVAVEKGYDSELSSEQRLFLYMPFMHSESKVVHETAVMLFTQLGNQEALDFEHKHKAIVDQFGRYPHRNQQLGRASTPAEQAFLAESNEAFFNS